MHVATLCISSNLIQFYRDISHGHFPFGVRYCIHLKVATIKSTDKVQRVIRMVFFPNGMQAEAVIFDFDGIIVDTEPLHYKSFQRVLSPLGLSFTWQEYLDNYIGFDDRDAFREAFAVNKETLDPIKLQSLIAQKASAFQEVTQNGVTAYPGAVELIRKLKNTNIPIAICSGALKSDIDPILLMLGLTDCFDTIITADDVASSKPDPECYEMAFRKLLEFRDGSFPKNMTFAIEDTPAGISAAKHANLNVCAVTNSYAAELLSDATFITCSLETLLDIRII